MGQMGTANPVLSRGAGVNGSQISAFKAKCKQRKSAEDTTSE